MPNPKSGTIAKEIGKTVKELSGGKTEFKADNTGNIHIMVGKVKDTPKSLKENILTLFEASSAYSVRNISICTTMGPGIKIEPDSVTE